ncbi:MAG: 4-(cytidine 5'-diphospho)-2-C-methyl-D-erythritol kinase, partial [Nanoarchaeota archaeon]|nr:4-(cytidine 5'-diphospho)-2-C-methyl-D-erythritol kinase [Nanoarchaeota archaeon]
AYNNIDYEKTGKQLKTAEMLNAIKEEDINKIAENMHNDFEYSICKEHPIINEIKKKMIQNGALNALMSGSGPTVFGITEEKAVAENIYNSLTKNPYFKKNLDFVYITQTR